MPITFEKTKNPRSSPGADRCSLGCPLPSSIQIPLSFKEKLESIKEIKGRAESVFFFVNQWLIESISRVTSSLCSIPSSFKSDPSRKSSSSVRLLIGAAAGCPQDLAPAKNPRAEPLASLFRVLIAARARPGTPSRGQMSRF
jgi:hypothetical protein